jgi:hypothetical protein
MIRPRTDGLGLPLQGPFKSGDFSVKFAVACILNKVMISFIRVQFCEFLEAKCMITI